MIKRRIITHPPQKIGEVIKTRPAKGANNSNTTRSEPTLLDIRLLKLLEAYKSKPEAPPFVDKLLGIDQSTPTTRRLIANAELCL